MPSTLGSLIVAVTVTGVPTPTAALAGVTLTGATVCAEAVRANRNTPRSNGAIRRIFRPPTGRAEGVDFNEIGTRWKVEGRSLYLLPSKRAQLLAAGGNRRAE